jgi:ethanolamine utilization protein EutQ (cupin superfamily)
MLFLIKNKEVQMKPSTKQTHAVIAALTAETNWDVLNSQMLQKIIEDPKTAGAQFTAFLKMGGKVIVDGPRVISIDRTEPFDPAKFIGDGWTIEEQDERSLALTEVDLTEAAFETTLKKGEKTVGGEEKLKRLKEDGRIRLDAGIFRTLWENQHLIPEKWKEQTNGNTTFIYFDGTVLRDSGGSRYVLCLCWSGGGWNWYYDWLGGDWDARSPSVVLASSTVASDASAS